MSRIKTYARAIRNEFNWSRVREEAASEGYCLLGSVFALTPSGKFYAPFACSNVMGCKRCKGTGTVTNRRADAAKYARMDAAITEYLHHLWATEGMAVNWSSPSAYLISMAREERDQYRATLTCTWCDGTGSHEAAKDADWHAALERVAKQFGLFVGGPDGADGCDVFVGDADALARMESAEAAE